MMCRRYLSGKRCAKCKEHSHCGVGQYCSSATECAACHPDCATCDGGGADDCDSCDPKSKLPHHYEGKIGGIDLIKVRSC